MVRRISASKSVSYFTALLLILIGLAPSYAEDLQGQVETFGNRRIERPATVKVSGERKQEPNTGARAAQGLDLQRQRAKLDPTKKKFRLKARKTDLRLHQAEANQVPAVNGDVSSFHGKALSGTTDSVHKSPVKLGTNANRLDAGVARSKQNVGLSAATVRQGTSLSGARLKNRIDVRAAKLQATAQKVASKRLRPSVSKGQQRTVARKVLRPSAVANDSAAVLSAGLKTAGSKLTLSTEIDNASFSLPAKEDAGALLGDVASSGLFASSSDFPPQRRILDLKVPAVARQSSSATAEDFAAIEQEYAKNSTVPAVTTASTANTAGGVPAFAYGGVGPGASMRGGMRCGMRMGRCR